MARVVVTVLVAVVLGSAMPAAAIHSHHGVLMGVNEVSQEGDADAWGVAAATVHEGSLFYYILVRASEMPTGAHIHRGGPTTNGGVVIPFQREFVPLGDGVSMTHGIVSVDEQLADELAANPRGFYFNVHTASHPAGAARAQLIGSARSNDVWAAYLGGNAKVGLPGPAEAAGYSLFTHLNGRLYYYLLSLEAEMVSGAHIHDGASFQDGAIVVDLGATLTPVVGYEEAAEAIGNVPITEEMLRRLRSTPSSLYANVHSPDYPDGVMRGQLLRAERRLVVPVVTRTNGMNQSRWRTTCTFGNQVRNDASALVRFYPSSPSGLTEALTEKTLIVPAESHLTLEDMVGTFLNAQGNGAVEIITQQPVEPYIRILNDQSNNMTVRGAYSQVFQAVPDDASILHQGVLYGLYNHSDKAHLPARTNLGWFNPAPDPVTITFTAYATDSTRLGSSTITVPGYAHWQDQIFNLITVPPTQREQLDFYVAYSCSASGAAVYASVVDNFTNDGATVQPLPTQTE